MKSILNIINILLHILVLFSTAKISKKFYPNSDVDLPDKSLEDYQKVQIEQEIYFQE